MEYSSIIPRQLAPTVGQEAAGARNRARSAFGAISTTMAVGLVNYFGNLPYIPTPTLRPFAESTALPSFRSARSTFTSDGPTKKAPPSGTASMFPPSPPS